MEEYATREEIETLKQLVSRMEIEAHVSLNFAFTALTFCKETDKVIDALEKSYEAGLTELTFSRATDEDIEFYKNLYRSYINQIRLLSR